MPGFIHDELDVKLLILYIMSRTAGPVDFATLTDLAMCDSGVDYFLFAQAVSDLVKSGNLSFMDGLYSATAKGRENSATLETSLPIVVRGRCDRALAPLNASIRRAAQVSAKVMESDGQQAAVLRLSDDEGLLMELSLNVPSETLAGRITERFKERPEEIYNRILAILLEEAGTETEETPKPEE